jgi:hypothetical protein
VSLSTITHNPVFVFLYLFLFLFFTWRSVLLVEYGGWSMVFSQSLPRVVGSRVQGPTTLGRDWVFSVYSAYRENHHPATSHWQTLSHNVESNTPCLSGIQTVIYIFSVITISIRLFLYYILILFWIPYNNITERTMMLSSFYPANTHPKERTIK